MKRIHKKKILRIITTLNPEYGGPINAILHNSRALIKKGIIPSESVACIV